MVDQGDIDIVHDQNLLISEARLSVDVGITKRFGASLMLPFRVVDTSIRYLDMAGSEVQLVNANIHHRNETVSGLADPMLLGSASFGAAGWRFVARAGMTLPIGRTESNPFTLGDLGLRHQHIQLGTGTLNPVVGAEVARSWGPWRFGAFAMTQQVLYASSKGYQAGDRYATGLVASRRLGTRWSLRATADALGETAERWDGIKHTDDGNQGRFDLIFGAGASWAMTPKLSLDLALKIPAVTRSVGGQLAMPAIVEVGASWSFGGGVRRTAVHDHARDAHDAPADVHVREPSHPDVTGLDIFDLGKPGEQVALVPVAGKVTIFDFWATWCEPCKVLEPALVEIARAHPEVVAIRRIDAVDWDSAVVAQHLTPRGFGLPHIKVFDRSGRLLLERSSEPGKLEVLIDDIRRFVEGGSAIEAKKPPPIKAPLAKTPVVSIAVTAKGFEPNNVVVSAGKPVTLRFERTVEKTCATEVALDVDGKRIVKDLPLGKRVDLTLTFTKRGEIRYACAMDMIRGTITVR